MTYIIVFNLVLNLTPFLKGLLMSFETVKNVRLQKVPDRLNVNYLQTEG